MRKKWQAYISDGLENFNTIVIVRNFAQMMRDLHIKLASNNYARMNNVI